MPTPMHGMQLQKLREQDTEKYRIKPADELAGAPAQVVLASIDCFLVVGHMPKNKIIDHQAKYRMHNIFS